MAVWTDQDWVKLLKQGDQEALQELWESLFRWCTLAVRKYGADDDIAQNAAVDAYQRVLKYGIKNYAGRGSFLGYCRVTAVHEVHRELKRQRRPDISLEDLPEHQLPMTPEVRPISGLPYDLEKCLERLDANKRQVVTSLYFDEESPELVASRLQTTKGNIYVLKNRLLGILLNCLKSKGHDNLASVLES